MKRGRDLGVTKGSIKMQTFRIGEKVTIKSETTPMFVTRYNDDTPKSVDCLWFDDFKNAIFEMIPEAILKSLEENRSRQLIIQRNEETFLASDVVQPSLCEIEMTILDFTNDELPTRVTCYWLNTDKQLQKAQIPIACLRRTSD